MFKPPIFLECPSSLLTVGLQSSSCGVSIFLLWCFHFYPYGHHLYPFSGSRCSYLKGCVYTRGGTPWLGSSRHMACALLCGPASSSLTLGGESLLSSVLWEITLSSCVPVSRVTLPESLLTACLLGSGPDTELSPAASCLLLCMLCEAGPSWQQHTVCYAYRDVTDLEMV